MNKNTGNRRGNDPKISSRPKFTLAAEEFLLVGEGEVEPTQPRMFVEIENVNTEAHIVANITYTNNTEVYFTVSPGAVLKIPIPDKRIETVIIQHTDDTEIGTAGDGTLVTGLFPVRVSFASAFSKVRFLDI